MNKITIACALALGAQAGAAWAEDNTVDLGVVHFQIDATTTGITGPYTPAGLNLSVGNSTSLFLAYTRRVWGPLDVEIEGGIPPKFSVYGKGPATLGSVPYANQTIATARSFTPAAFVNYNFFDRSSAWDPYVGLGVNYTNFYNISSTPAGNQANGGYTRLALSNSWGAAGHIGLRYRFNSHWSVNSGVTVANVESTLTTDTDGIGRQTRINFHPTVFVFSAGYSF